MRGELSPRQAQALRAIADGKTDVETAREMFVGERTARQHVEDVLTKLGARNRANAVDIAHKRGLLK